MTLITTAQVKAFLGIASGTTTYDASITAKIPLISAAIKRITNNKMTLQIKGEVEAFTGGGILIPDTIASGGCLVYDGSYVDTTLDDCLQVGQIIEGDGIPAGSYISEIYSMGGYKQGNTEYDTPVIVVTGTCVSTLDSTAYISIPIDLQSIIAKGIWWMISQENTKLNDTAWTSRTVGPLSITRSEIDAKADGTYGMPAWFIKALPRYHR